MCWDRKRCQEAEFNKKTVRSNVVVHKLFYTTLATRIMDSLLAPLSPFLALPGDPPIPWIRWHESFETFIVAAGLSDASDGRKRALLLHSLGCEGQRIFRTLGPAQVV